MAKQTVIIYWLMPAAKYRELFAKLIQILAQKFDAPRFEAHLTLGRANDMQAARKSLRQVRARPLRLRLSEIAYSSKFTKTLFVRFRPSASLDRLLVQLGAKSKSVRHPHVSLLYKRLPRSIKNELGAIIRLPFQEVHFDRIQALQCPSPTETRADVESWRVIATRRLSG